MELTPIVGKVAAANAKGVRLEGEDSWRNISKYAVPAPALPSRGEQVILGLDPKGFVRSITPAHRNGHTTPAAPAVDDSDVLDYFAEDSAPPTIRKAAPAPVTTAPDRERCIARMAALNTAVAVLSSAGRAVDPAEAVALAARLEAWVYRPT